MVRGGLHGILPETQLQAYKKLKQILNGEVTKIYELHTHPYNNYAPSGGDIEGHILDRLQDNENLDKFGVIMVGLGIITPVAITLLKLNYSKAELEYLTKKLPDWYRLQTNAYVSESIGRKMRNGVMPQKDKVYLNEFSEAEYAKLQQRPQLKTLRDMTKNAPKQIHSKTIRRNTFRTKVRR